MGYFTDDMAQQIAEMGKELYKRLNVFGGHLSKVGKELDTSVQAYNSAIGSLNSRVVPSIRRLKEMGTGTEDFKDISPIDTQVRSTQSISKLEDD